MKGQHLVVHLKGIDMKEFDLVIDLAMLVVVLVGASGLLASGMCIISYIVY